MKLLVVKWSVGDWSLKMPEINTCKSWLGVNDIQLPEFACEMRGGLWFG
jgi:hypothetical protein